MLHLFHEEWALDGGRDALAMNNAVYLYNFADDIGKRKNLANSSTAKLGDLLAWFKATGALLPTQPNPKYDADAATTGGKNVRKKA